MPILSLTYVPAKSAESLAAEANLHILTLYHQCSGPILMMWGTRIGTDLRLPSHDILWGCADSLGEALEKSIVASPTQRQIDLVTQCPVLY